MRERRDVMTQLNQMELQNLRELIGCHDTLVHKLKFYSNQCNDPQLRSMMEQSSKSASDTKDRLISFLE